MSDYTNLENLRFLLNEVHDIEDVLKYERYADYDPEAVEILLQSTKDTCDKEYFPFYREMDEDPARFENGKLYVHPQIGKVVKMAGENGSIGAQFDYEDGGQQMPHLLYGALSHIQAAANNNVGGYFGLTAGAAGLIIAFGSEELKKTYVPKMLAGEWAGTMCLTEPQAGSSLSDITSSATPQEDGSYKIKGQKIYISGGDHEYNDNFIHLYLARIDGAPSGTKGISLFVVPKKRIAENGNLISNDVQTAGDFQKVGQRGYCTTHLILGEKDDCQGWLVGAPNKGLSYMFQMMNGARIDVGMTAASIATAAYYASLQYAKDRPQGRKLSSDGSKNPSEEQTLIINHPDVRRMLLLQKAVSEASVSLLLRCSRLLDVAHNEEGEVAEDAHDMVEWLTPIAKTYPSEMGIKSVSTGLQVLGGAGFCSEYILQQYYRDIRIMSIYEGTTGIQSLDLLGRKSTIKNGRALQLIGKEVQQAVDNASTFDDLKPYADKLASKMKDMQEVFMHLLQFAMKGNHERFLADATLFMEFASTIVVAWHWLEMATESKKALVTGQLKQTEDFYESKIHTMKYYFKYELPKTSSLKETLLDSEVLTIMKEKELIS
jgi:butyryl-CoA dehydrogenase